MNKEITVDELRRMWESATGNSYIEHYGVPDSWREEKIKMCEDKENEKYEE